MLYAILVAAALLLAAVLYFGIRGFRLRESARFNASRVLTCPETDTPVTVETGGIKTLRVQDCTRWPEKRDCGQACLLQVHESPDGCLVRTKVQVWCEGKSCVLCDKPLDPAMWVTQPPCVMTPDRVTREWKSVPPDQIAEALEHGKPVCWTCHVAQEFRRERPDLILERENNPQMRPAGHHS